MNARVFGPAAKEALFRSLFDGTSDVIVVCDDAGRIALVNSACERLLGWTAEELEGRPIETLVPARFAGHAAEREKYAREPRARTMGGGAELVALHKEGHEVPVDISLTPICDGETKWVAAALRDMRGRAYAGDTLRVQATALRSAANGIVITDRAGIITWVNPAACAITGYSAAELVGRHTRTLKSGAHDEAFYAELWRTVTRGDTWSGTIVNRRKDGTQYHEEQSIAPVIDERGAITHFIAIKQDVTEKRRTEEDLARAQAELAAHVSEIESLNGRLQEKAIRDPLTGLHNRRYFDESIADELRRATERGAESSILVSDVDHFKVVNDTHGHHIGDRVLRGVAEVLGARVRPSDMTCRYGGEEFLVVMVGAPTAVAARRAQQIRSDLAGVPFKGRGDQWFHVTVSIGIATARAREETIKRTLARADSALYAAKAAGRDCIVCAPQADPSAPSSDMP